MPKPRSTRRRFWFLLALAVAGVLSVEGGLAFLVLHPVNGIWEGQLKADLDKQLPDGSTWDEADAWFAAHGIPTSRIAQFKNGSSRDQEIIGMSALIPNESLIEQNAAIHVELYFDPNGRLYKRVIYRFAPSF